MRILLKFLLSGLLLALLVAIGAAVMALRHKHLPPLAAGTPTVVVRKSTTAPMPPKTVRPVVGHPPTFFRLHNARKHKSPAG